MNFEAILVIVDLVNVFYAADVLDVVVVLDAAVELQLSQTLSH